MRALFIPFDWIASERVYGQLPGCRLTQFKVSGASGRVGAADGEKIAAAQITHTHHQPTQ